MKTLFDGDFLRLIRDRHWEYVCRNNASGAGFIVALTDQNELVLVEQHRIPLGCPVIELPAGLIGDDPQAAQELPQAAALRELEEETGYRANQAEILCSGPVAAGMTSEMGHFLFLSGLRKVGDGGGVDGENIRVHVVPLASVDQWLKQQTNRGVLVDPRIYVGLYFLDKIKK